MYKNISIKFYINIENITIKLSFDSRVRHFFFNVKLITLNYTKTENITSWIPDFQYSLVFPQPKHFGLTHLLQTACVQSYFLTDPHD